MKEVNEKNVDRKVRCFLISTARWRASQDPENYKFEVPDEECKKWIAEGEDNLENMEEAYIASDFLKDKYKLSALQISKINETNKKITAYNVCNGMAFPTLEAVICFVEYMVPKVPLKSFAEYEAELKGKKPKIEFKLGTKCNRLDSI